MHLLPQVAPLRGYGEVVYVRPPKPERAGQGVAFLAAFRYFLEVFALPPSASQPLASQAPFGGLPWHSGAAAAAN
eukprot:6034921-Pyramimonas_sp.AAC.1